MPIPIIALTLTVVITAVADFILNDTEYKELLSIGRVVHY
jgi:hypothetical protein